MVISALASKPEKTNPEEPIVLLVKVCACCSNTKLSLAVKLGIVAITDPEVGVVALKVTVLVAPLPPSTSWFDML